MVQEYTSKNTSINKNKVPKLFTLIENNFGWREGTTNLDIGGGKYDTATEYLNKFGVQNFIYDKYNRSKDHNTIVEIATRHEKPDTVTISNVLNVIKEKKIRGQVINLARTRVKKGGLIFISVYNSGREGESKKDCWQNAMTIDDYLEEVQAVFPNAFKKYGIIVATRD